MPKFLSEGKTLKMLNYAMIAVTVLLAIFTGSRVIDDVMRIPGVAGVLSPLGIGPSAGMNIMNILFTIVMTLLAIWIGYMILKLVVSTAYEKDVLTNNEILFMYLVSSIVAILVGIFTGFAGDFRVLVTTITYLVVLFILANLFLKWKKYSSNKVNMHLAVYAVVLVILALPMVRNLIVQ